MYTEWITLHEPWVPDPYKDKHIYTVYPATTPCLPKRWLHPYNESGIISLLRSHSIFLLLNLVWSTAKSPFAGLSDVVRYFQHPEATNALPLAILELDPDVADLPLDGYCSGRVFQIFKIAIEKVELSFELMDRLLESAWKRRKERDIEYISRIAFRSGRRGVIDWALKRGLAPTTRFLRDMYPPD
jgi:hypothetical protein